MKNYYFSFLEVNDLTFEKKDLAIFLGVFFISFFLESSFFNSLLYGFSFLVSIFKSSSSVLVIFF